MSIATSENPFVSPCLSSLHERPRHLTSSCNNSSIEIIRDWVLLEGQASFPPTFGFWTLISICNHGSREHSRSFSPGSSIAAFGIAGLCHYTKRRFCR